MQLLAKVQKRPKLAVPEGLRKKVDNYSRALLRWALQSSNSLGSVTGPRPTNLPLASLPSRRDLKEAIPDFTSSFLRSFNRIIFFLTDICVLPNAHAISRIVAPLMQYISLSCFSSSACQGLTCRMLCVLIQSKASSAFSPLTRRNGRNISSSIRTSVCLFT